MNTYYFSENEILAVTFDDVRTEDLAVGSFLASIEVVKCFENELYSKGMDCFELQSYEEAYCYFIESIMIENNPLALNKLGIMYADGLYVEENVPRACRYFEIANKYGAEQRPGDYLMMGAYHHYDIAPGRAEGLYRDLNLAIKWYKKVIECGKPVGYSSLGCVYFEKEMLNYKKAYECFEKSGWDDPRSLYYTGFIFEFGLYKRRNLDLAKYYFERILNENDSIYAGWHENALKRLTEIKENRVPILRKGYYFGSDSRVD